MTFIKYYFLNEDVDINNLPSYDELLKQKGLSVYQIRGLKKTLKIKKHNLRYETGSSAKELEKEIKIIKKLLKGY